MNFAIFLDVFDAFNITAEPNSKEGLRCRTAAVGQGAQDCQRHTPTLRE
jgi:hypothetical protein